MFKSPSMYPYLIITLSCLLSASLPLDFFLFNRFYKDGKCGNKSELAQYKILNEDQTLHRDQRVSLQMLTDTDHALDFVVIFSDYHKKSLWSAHKFFTNIVPELQIEERQFFPNLITCLEDSFFIYSFGLLDSYGLIFELSPSIKEYQRGLIGENRLSFLDIIDIYLDVLKAFRVLIRNDYFVKDFSNDDIGIVNNVSHANAHVRGKIRSLDRFRVASDTCNPETMRTFAFLEANYKAWNIQYELADDIDLSTAESCQNTNLWDLFQSFLETMNKYYTEVRGENSFPFQFCLVYEDQENPCPVEFDFIWKKSEIKKKLMLVRKNIMRYTSASVVAYLIYVLESVKTDYLINLATKEQNFLSADIQHKRQVKEDVQKHNSEIVVLESSMKALLDTQKQSEISQFDKTYHTELNMQLKTPNLTNVEINILKKYESEPFRDNKYVNGMKQYVNLGYSEEFSNLELQKEKLIMENHDEMEGFRSSIRKTRKSIARKFKKLSKQASHHSDEFTRNPINTRMSSFLVVDAIKQNNSQELDDIKEHRSPIVIPHMNSQKNYSKINVEGSYVLIDEIEHQKRPSNSNIKFHDKTMSSVHSSQNSQLSTNDEEVFETARSSQRISKKQAVSMDQTQSQISYFSKDQTSSQGTSSLTSNLESQQSSSLSNFKFDKALAQNFERQSLEVAGLSLDFDEDFSDPNIAGFTENFLLETQNVDTNQKVFDRFGITQKSEELNQHPGMQQQFTSEAFLILENKNIGKLDGLQSLQHTWKSQILVKSSLVFEQRELKKMNRLKEILGVKKSLIFLKSQNSGVGTKEITEIETLLQTKITELSMEFGEVDTLFLNEKGLVKTTVKDLMEDLGGGNGQLLTGVVGLDQNTKIYRDRIRLV